MNLLDVDHIIRSHIGSDGYSGFRSAFEDGVNKEDLAKIIGEVLQAVLADDQTLHPESSRWHEPIGGRREDLQPLIDKLLNGEME